MTLRERLWNLCSPEPNTGCWIWTGAVSGGRTTASVYAYVKTGGRMRCASRVTWEEIHGAIPPGMFVCHRCDQPTCVNPDHLFLGTHQENMIDMVSKGRWRSPAAEARANRTHCPSGHPYTPDNTWISAKNQRHCRACHRERARVRRACPRAPEET